MVIALLAAAVTCVFVPVDREYLGYYDYKTLTCLFCVLAVVCALRDINYFYMLARKVVHLFKNARMSILALVYITFIGSMLIADRKALKMVDYPLLLTFVFFFTFAGNMPGSTRCKISSPAC